MENTLKTKQILSRLFQVALDAVDGCYVVEQALKRTPIEGDIAVVAIGKAAAAMMLGAQNELKDQIQSALVITKVGHSDKFLDWPCIESGHPIPNEVSLKAGANLLEFIENIPKDTKLLVLISGGASALVEVLPDNMDLKKLQKINEWLLGSGLTINEMNQVRQSVSLIKGGKTLNYLSQNKLTQFLISDVKGDSPSIIGSGLFVAEQENNGQFDISTLPEWLRDLMQPKEHISSKVVTESHIVASNEVACEAIINKAKEQGYTVNYHGQTLYGDVYEMADSLAVDLKNAELGIHIWGGETTIVLPEDVGRGGRNQSLALALACELENTKGITILVGATDGGDGPTEDAGAIIDGLTLQRGGENADDYLSAADAGTYLAEAGDLISTGPTGTNVMDIIIALKEEV